MKKPTVYFDSKGPSGNIYAVLANTRTALRKQSRIQDYNDCYFRVLDSGSYNEALSIIREYVILVDTSGQF